MKTLKCTECGEVFDFDSHEHICKFIPFQDIEEDEQEAYTRCEKCGCRVMLKNLKKHKEVKHNGKSKSN